MASALAGCGKESSIAKDEKIVTTIHADDDAEITLSQLLEILQ